MHEESSYLAVIVREDALELGENVVIDGVMSNEDKAMRLANELARAGYDIQVVDVEVPAEVSRRRIAQRWAEQTNTSELGGRWVPSEFRESVFDTENGAASRCDRVARAVAEQVRQVSRYRRFFTSAEDARQAVATPQLTDHLCRDENGQLHAARVPPARTKNDVLKAIHSKAQAHTKEHSD